MAARLGMDVASFRRTYARQLSGRWSLRERKTEHGYDCVFLDRESHPGRAICSLYEARPRQCRTWPFWPENLRTPRGWASAKHMTPCPGMDNGPLIPVEQIRIQREAMEDAEEA